MECDLDKSGRKCVLRSPVINDTHAWACMRIKYLLSSDDVKLKLDVFSGDLLVDSRILLASMHMVYIKNKDLGSSVSIQLTASRYLASTADYESASVTSVKLTQCPANTGRLCVNSSVTAWCVLRMKELSKVMHKTY